MIKSKEVKFLAGGGLFMSIIPLAVLVTCHNCKQLTDPDLPSKASFYDHPVSSLDSMVVSGPTSSVITAYNFPPSKN
jgi:hypothetical protein